MPRRHRSGGGGLRRPAAGFGGRVRRPGGADARSAAEFRAVHTGREPDFVPSEIKSHFQNDEIFA